MTTIPTLIAKLNWFYVTRGLGVLLILYGVLFDRTGERTTIILGGLGLLGYEKVARSDSATKKDGDRES